MKRLLLATVAFALTACSDTPPTAVTAATSAPTYTYTPQPGATWRIFNGLSPQSTIDASPGYEVGTRFYVQTAGCITKLHYYQAAGETGTNTVKLWTDSGTLLSYADFTAFAGFSGWQSVSLAAEPSVGPPIDVRVCIQPYTYYRVSVNTNTKQVKTFGYFTNYGSIVHGPLVADYSYYGQPGSMPTTGSSSIYFVDVTFQES